MLVIVPMEHEQLSFEMIRVRGKCWLEFVFIQFISFMVPRSPYIQLLSLTHITLR
jgi:hypothetical protein